MKWQLPIQVVSSFIKDVASCLCIVIKVCFGTVATGLQVFCVTVLNVSRKYRFIKQQGLKENDRRSCGQPGQTLF